MSDKQHSNALLNQTSPYLLQHAHNPVNWYPWGEFALNKAREENKPILLSIGYSACHWCHVMAHESFEDDATADLMNRHFINIKVDREERPDLDKIYQTAHQLLTRRGGGWPLSMFLHPQDQIPFFGGTYFPPTSKYGMPGFKDLLIRVAEFYQQQAEDIIRQNQALLSAMEKMQSFPGTEQDTDLDQEPLVLFVEELSAKFDSINGGFSGAPKFPHPGNIELLLQLDGENKSSDRATDASNMALFTLEKMALGGIYDQLAGGFCRYSVDDEWMIPHFEKMLYDNGPLISVYTQAWTVSGRETFKRVVLESAAWICEEMQSIEGAYFSSLDADSEGVEGTFYLWSDVEVRSIIEKHDYDIFSQRFGLNKPANFEGSWHLRICNSIEALAETHSMSTQMLHESLERSRKKLLNERNKRVAPAKDDKVLTSWNALMIKAMSLAAIHFDSEELFLSAERSLSFIKEHLYRDGRLLATYKDGFAHLDAYLDDYAYLIEAILTLLSYRWSSDYLHLAIDLARVLMSDFYDKSKGGFFFTSHQHEKLIQRRKDFMDDAQAAGNGIAALVLARLAHLLGESDYLNASEKTLALAYPQIKEYPSAHASMLLALRENISPGLQIVIRGDTDEVQLWQRLARQHAEPGSSVFAIPNTESELPGSLQQREAIAETTAYLCSGFQCLAPITEKEEFITRLNDITKMT